MKKKHLILGLFLIFSASLIYASPAKKVILKFDKSEKTLSIEIDHKVKNTEKHYIDKIIIYINDEEYKTIELDKQQNLKGEELKIEMPDIKSGDEIEVKTYCNKFGRKSAKLLIE